MFQWLKNQIVSSNFANGCPELIQNEATECGAVSLEMVMEYYGVIIPPEVLRDKCQVSRDGSKASTLLKIARQYGFTADGYRIDKHRDILSCKMPAILFWECNHFLVCLGTKGGKWVLNDPACGQRIVSNEEMRQSFTGIVLEIKPAPGFKKQGRKTSFFSNMSYLLAPFKLELVLLVLMGILLLPQSVVQPNMNRLVIDYFFQEGYYNWGAPIFWVALVMLILTIGLSFIQHHSYFLLHVRMTMVNSGKILKKMFSLPVLFFQSRFSGDLVNRVQCCESIAHFFATQFAGNILSILSLIIFSILLIHYDQVLGIFVTIMALILFVIMLRFIKAEKVAAGKRASEYGKLYGRTVHGMTMIETLKASGMENEFFIYWADMYKRYEKTIMSLHKHIELLQFSKGIIHKVSLTLIVGYGAYRILLGEMSGGSYMAFQLIFGCFMVPVYNLIDMIDSFQKTRADANRLVDILRYPTPEVRPRDTSGDLQPVARMAGRVEIRDLVFGYNKNLPPVIDHVSLEIAPGERIAIVGLSGSGKSTMAKLISGAYEPWSGEILFDGRPRQSYSMQELRYSFAMVDQTVSLLPGNIRENIAMYDNTLPFSFIRQAAEDALIHDTITARHGGYSYEVNATGSNFSGGEKQRLEIARALAVNPAILLLDEATAALDPATELKFDRNVRRRGITSIVIAHRLSTIRDADRIVVLERGKIAEIGTHRELMKRNGIYAKLVNL